MTALDAIALVEGYANDLANFTPGTEKVPEFQVRCAMRKLARIAMAAHKEITAIEQRANEAHQTVMNA